MEVVESLGLQMMNLFQELAGFVILRIAGACVVKPNVLVCSSFLSQEIRKNNQESEATNEFHLRIIASGFFLEHVAQ